jgi:hypothetical protein
MKRRYACLWLLGALVPLLLAAGCGSRATPTPLPSPEPAYTLVPEATLTPVPQPSPTPATTPTLAAHVNPLTGMGVADPQVLRHRPLLVRYGHDRIARPPSGLSQAEVVFEELAEGAFVTRLTALYLETLPEVVGPLRSSRLVVIDLLHQFDAALVHSGASVGIAAVLSQLHYPMYESVGHGAGLFYRSAAKPSPHNLYIRLPDVRRMMISEGRDRAVELRGWTFSATPPAGRPATRVHIPYPGQAPVTYTYDEGSGTYLRLVEGDPHVDALTNAQLAVANVVVLYLEHRDSDIVEDDLGSVAIMVDWMGEGRLQIFRDGVVVEGRWQRETQSQLTRFKDASGHDIALKPGQTWVQIVPPGYNVTYR